MKPVMIEGGKLALLGPYVVELPEGTTAVNLAAGPGASAQHWFQDAIANTSLKKTITDPPGFAPIEVDDKSGGLDAPSGQHWGYELLLDMSDCTGPMDDDDAVREFMGAMVKALDMKVLMPMQLIHVHGKDGRGVTAVQTITTSSITFHGDDERHCIYLDVFSCAPYDPRVAFDLALKWFAPQHVGYRWLYRDAGEYPEKG